MVLDISPGEQMMDRNATLNEVFEVQMGLMWLTHQVMRELTAQHELHPPHLILLNMLGGRHPGLVVPQTGGLSMSDLSRSMDMPPATATAMVDRLTSLGLVERGPSEQDRRVVMVQLTQRGRAVSQEVHQVWQQIHHDSFTVLSDSQLAAHLELMKHVQRGILDRFPEGGRPSFAQRPAPDAREVS